jgi:hypothetical protein
MSVSGGPGIVTDGLVLLLDAANPDSYTSGSLIWHDLSGNSRHFNLGAGVGYDPSYGGGLIQPGTTMQTTASMSIPTTASAYIWAKTNDGTGIFFTTRITVTSGYIGAYSNSGSFYESGVGNVLYRINTTDTTTLAPYMNTGYFMIESYNIAMGGAVWNDGMRIGNYGSAFNWQATIACVAFYNRNLTAQERLQNFNAQRSRFGV